jgi:hypothetical protein
MKEKIMSANTETCANNDKSVCDYNEFRRLRYFHGMLLDEKDFREEQQYHAKKRRLLNRMLHGSGVVCGLELRGKKGKRSIQVTSGLALDCSGNEIWVSKDLKIDLASLLPPKNKPKGEPECKPVDGEDNLKTYYIGIRYDEKPTNPVSVYLPSGDCEERTCENSRWKEGYCVEIVECCYDDETPGLLKNLCDCEGNGPLDKEKYKGSCGKCGPDPSETKDPAAGTQPDPARAKEWCECMVFEEFCEQSVPCPECCSCDHPCHVILGQIKIDPQTGLLETVCMNECRRYVLTGRLVQQVFLRIVSGAEDRFQVKIPDKDPVKLKVGEKFADYIYNPIKALCFWLFYRGKGGDFDFLGCDMKPLPVEKEVERLVIRNQEVTNLLTTVQREHEAVTNRLNVLQKLAPVDLLKNQIELTKDTGPEVPAEKPTKPKK